jgi:prevent-host-death family protein
MRKASISEAKSNLSRLLEGVKRGDSILIFDRNDPVARLGPVSGESLTENEKAAALVRAAMVSPPRQELDVEEFLRRRRPRLAPGASAVAALIEERKAGR